MAIRLFNQCFTLRELWRMRTSLAIPPLQPRKNINYLRSFLSQRLRQPNPRGYPPFLMIEPTGHCNMSCPMCPIRTRHGRDGAGEMDIKAYRTLINEIGPCLYALSLWGWGEPTLHPHLAEMVSLATQKEIFTCVSTNAFSLDPAKSEALIHAGLDYLILSVDGATEETYARYRGKGKFGRVCENIRRMVKLREENKSVTPFLNLQFIVMRENEHEIPAVKRLARELGIDKLSLKKVQALNDEQKARLLPRDRRYHLSLYHSPLSPTPCWRPWTTPLVLWNGEMTTCCGDLAYAHTMGNVFGPGGFQSVWNNEKFVSFRKRILTDINSIPACRECAAKNYQDGFVS